MAKRSKGDRREGSTFSAIESPAQESADLHPDARELMREVTDSYAITDAGGQALLRQAGEALTRLRDAQAKIAEHGSTFVDRFGQIKAHPLLAAERDARRDFLAALKALNLDLEPLRDAPGRPERR